MSEAFHAPGEATLSRLARWSASETVAEDGDMVQAWRSGDAAAWETLVTRATFRCIVHLDSGVSAEQLREVIDFALRYELHRHTNAHPEGAAPPDATLRERLRAAAASRRRIPHKREQGAGSDRLDCTRCGARARDGAKFCVQCGARLQMESGTTDEHFPLTLGDVQPSL